MNNRFLYFKTNKSGQVKNYDTAERNCSKINNDETDTAQRQESGWFSRQNFPLDQSHCTYGFESTVLSFYGLLDA